ncbi:MAG: hypothetical protein L3J79_05095 [Candidatus Marinimicrobia bacterium]|nr:hypothetical protein [Candidatus Neomarinimicrobiota bacterium]
MNIKPIVRLFLPLLLPLLGFGQLSITGDITPNAMFRISDGSLINLPFRLGSITVDYSVGDFEFKSTTALETRWRDAEDTNDMLQFREAYVLWYPSFGEVKLGKMIQAWGAADANNPTDNLSPYDFYYMFMAGTDRKIGTLAAVSKIYLDDWQAEISLMPEHTPNRLPFNEPDFPISLPPEPDTRQFAKLENPLTYGLRLQRAFDMADFSISYLKGHDQMFSVFALEGAPPDLSPIYGYRNTNVFGLDGVLFPGNWTIRGEAAYMITNNPYDEPATAIFNVDAQYLQYVFQVEYELANQIQLMGQMIGTEIVKAQGRTLQIGSTGLPSILLLDQENFQPGMGTPFAIISDKVIIVSTMATILDNSLDLNAMVMANLEETGYMANLGSSYSIMESLKFEAALAYFIGGDEEGNSFRELEDFSNLTLGLTYSF